MEIAKNGSVLACVITFTGEELVTNITMWNRYNYENVIFCNYLC